jgi:formylmethanofuran dehydrogenase subunit E
MENNYHINGLPDSTKKLKIKPSYIRADPHVMKIFKNIKKQMDQSNQNHHINKNIGAKYFDPKKNKYLFSYINEINNLSDKRCSYCEKEPITSYSKYKNGEAHFVCSQNCSDKIFHNLFN